MKQSEVVLVAAIAGQTSGVLAGEAGIYTEYHAAAKSILKNQTHWNSRSLDVVHLGGAVQTAGGRVLRHRLASQGRPLETGRTYLMFLTYFEPGDCFQIVKLWEINGGMAAANSDDDLERVRLGTSTVNGMLTGALLESVRAAVNK